MKNKVIFAGAGPGAKDLITLRAQAAVAEADVIIYAGSLVNPEILEFAKTDAVKINSATLSLPQVIKHIKDYTNKGLRIVRLHTGDPAMYGAISEQLNALDKLEIPYEIIPGVSSVFAAAAAAQAELTMPGITQTAILTRRAGKTPVPDSEELKLLANNDASLALFLSVADMPGVVKDLLEAGRPINTPIAVVYRASWPNQKIIKGTLKNIATLVEENGIKRQAIVLVGKALERNGDFSLLYDNKFSHGYRGNKASENFVGKVAIYAITQAGASKASEIAGGMEIANIFLPEYLAPLPSQQKFSTFCKNQLEALVKDNWDKYEAHLFIMASGIVVRKIAPLLQGKTQDPAIVVCDELGNNAISLVGGHIAGANRLARKVAGITGGKAIITTATDVNKLLAFDEFAAINKFYIETPNLIKDFNARLLTGKEIDLLIPKSEFERYYSNTPNVRLISSLSEAKNPLVALDAVGETSQGEVLRLSGQRYVVGIGCRKNTPQDAIEYAVKTALKKVKLRLYSIALIASADLKREENGLLKFATANNLSIKFFTKEELNKVKTPNISLYAKEYFGINSVAEAAAMLAADTNCLLLEKQKIDGVTIAIAKLK